MTKTAEEKAKELAETLYPIDSVPFSWRQEDGFALLAKAREQIAQAYLAGHDAGARAECETLRENVVIEARRIASTMMQPALYEWKKANAALSSECERLRGEVCRQKGLRDMENKDFERLRVDSEERVAGEMAKLAERLWIGDDEEDAAKSVALLMKRWKEGRK